MRVDLFFEKNRIWIRISKMFKSWSRLNFQIPNPSKIKLAFQYLLTKVIIKYWFINSLYWLLYRKKKKRYIWTLLGRTQRWYSITVLSLVGPEFGLVFQGQIRIQILSPGKKFINAIIIKVSNFFYVHYFLFFFSFLEGGKQINTIIIIWWCGLFMQLTFW